jgi:hypothetical protein
MKSPLESLAPDHCSCGWPEDECVCCDTEKAVRLVAQGKSALNPEQREWCLLQIGRVEGYRRSDYEKATDAEIASGVLQSWVDYCRDKGLM